MPPDPHPDLVDRIRLVVRVDGDPAQLREHAMVGRRVDRLCCLLDVGVLARTRRVDVEEPPVEQFYLSDRVTGIPEHEVVLRRQGGDSKVRLVQSLPEGGLVLWVPAVVEVVIYLVPRPCELSEGVVVPVRDDAGVVLRETVRDARRVVDAPVVVVCDRDVESIEHVEQLLGVGVHVDVCVEVERPVERGSVKVRDLVGEAVVRIIDLDHVVELELRFAVRCDRNRDLRHGVANRLCGAFGFGDELIAGCDVEDTGTNHAVVDVVSLLFSMMSRNKYPISNAPTTDVVLSPKIEFPENSSLTTNPMTSAWTMRDSRLAITLV